MRSDFDIKRDVEDKLRSDPDIDIDATDIAIAVKDGVVTLTGFEGGARCQACRWRVGMANNIEVRLPIVHRRPDPEIARDAVEEIQRDLPSSWEKIKSHRRRRMAHARRRGRVALPM